MAKAPKVSLIYIWNSNTKETEKLK